MKVKLLYVYEERVPQKLRDLVLSFIPENYAVRSMTYLTSIQDQCELMAWANVVLFAPGRKLDQRVLEAARNVKVMQLWSSGYDKFSIAETRALGIPVGNNGGANAISVSEHALLLMLSVFKWLPDSSHRTVTGNWKGNSHGVDMFLMHKKTVGILGFGNIGREVARRCKGFGMNILYHDINRADKELESEIAATYVDIDTLYKEADILTLHMHHTDQTRGIIDQKALSKMKDSAILINVSRAELVDQDALLNALENGELHGAGVDVHYKEPTDGTEALLQLPNVVSTPHMAGSTYDTYEHAIGNCLENFERAMKGEELKWIVNGVSN